MKKLVIFTSYHVYTKEGVLKSWGNSNNTATIDDLTTLNKDIMESIRKHQKNIDKTDNIHILSMNVLGEAK